MRSVRNLRGTAGYALYVPANALLKPKPIRETPGDPNLRTAASSIGGVRGSAIWKQMIREYPHSGVTKAISEYPYEPCLKANGVDVIGQGWMLCELSVPGDRNKIGACPNCIAERGCVLSKYAPRLYEFAFKNAISLDEDGYDCMIMWACSQCGLIERVGAIPKDPRSDKLKMYEAMNSSLLKKPKPKKGSEQYCDPYG